MLPATHSTRRAPPSFPANAAAAFGRRPPANGAFDNAASSAFSRDKARVIKDATGFDSAAKTAFGGRGRNDLDSTASSAFGDQANSAFSGDRSSTSTFQDAAASAFGKKERRVDKYADRPPPKQIVRANNLGAIMDHFLAGSLPASDRSWSESALNKKRIASASAKKAEPLDSQDNTAFPTLGVVHDAAKVKVLNKSFADLMKERVAEEEAAEVKAAYDRSVAKEAERRSALDRRNMIHIPRHTTANVYVAKEEEDDVVDEKSLDYVWPGEKQKAYTPNEYEDIEDKPEEEEDDAVDDDE